MWSVCVLPLQRIALDVVCVLCVCSNRSGSDSISEWSSKVIGSFSTTILVLLPHREQQRELMLHSLHPFQPLSIG